MAWWAVAALGMPLSIFLFLGWTLAARARLDQHGIVAPAVVTSVRPWIDPLDGIQHQTVGYQFPVGGNSYASSANVVASGKGYAAGDRFSVIYLPSRPASAKLVTSDAKMPTGLTVIMMLAMVALMVWLASLYA